jgi:hypothetical protein
MMKLLAISLLVFALVGCAAPATPDRPVAPIETVIAAATAVVTAAPTLDPVELAALEATHIVQSARATAIIKQAQAEAAAFSQPTPTVVPTPVVADAATAAAAAPMVTRTVAAVVATAPSGPQTPAPSPTASIRLVRVGFAANGEYIHVEYFAPPVLISQWRQGLFSVIDEATGEVYNEVPVMPIVGPMIGRPVRPEQMAYVMLVNRVPQLQPGAMVTVVLDKFRFEHIVVEQ